MLALRWLPGMGLASTLIISRRAGANLNYRSTKLLIFRKDVPLSYGQETALQRELAEAMVTLLSVNSVSRRRQEA